MKDEDVVWGLQPIKFPEWIEACTLYVPIQHFVLMFCAGHKSKDFQQELLKCFTGDIMNSYPKLLGMAINIMGIDPYVFKAVSNDLEAMQKFLEEFCYGC